MLRFGRCLRTGCVLIAIVAGMVGANTVQADEGFRRFFPMLIELPGWKADAPDGASIEMLGQSMTNADRKYERGDTNLHAQILIGAAAQAAMALTQQIKIETPDARISTDMIDSFQVTKSFDKREHSGMIIVKLSPTALFIMEYNGIAEDEAFPLAQKFNWKAVQGAVPK